MTPGTAGASRLVRQRGFSCLWLSAFVSDAGDWLLFIALPVVVYAQSGSALGTSTAFLLELAPGVLLAPIIGRCVDRFDKRRLGVVIAAAQAVTLLPLVMWPHALAVVYLVITGEAALAAVAGPIRNALVPSVVAMASELPRANSLIALGDNLARLVGGPLGGLVLAVGGLPAVVMLDAVSFVVAGVLLIPARAVSSRADVPSCPGAEPDRTSGLRHLVTSPPLRRPLLVLAITQIAQGLFVVLFVVFVVQRLRGGSTEVGVLRGVQAVGAIAAGVALAGLPAHRRPRALIVIGTATCGLIEMAIWNGPAWTTAPVLYVALFIAAGAPGLFVGVGLTTELQAAAPATQHGRLFSLVGLTSNVGQGLGMVAAGVLVAPLGLTTVLNGQAALFLVAAAAAVGIARPPRTSLPRTDPRVDQPANWTIRKWLPKGSRAPQSMP